MSQFRHGHRQQPALASITGGVQNCRVLGQQAGHGVNKQSMHIKSVALSTLHLWAIKICRTTVAPVTDTSTNLYTWPNLLAWLGLFIVGQLQPQRVMSMGWQRSVGPLTWERQAWFVIWLRCSFPSFHFLGAAPNHSCAASAIPHCVTMLQHSLLVCNLCRVPH